MEWISVKDRLPEDGEKVVVWQENKVDKECSRHHCAFYYIDEKFNFFMVYPAVFKSHYKSTESFKGYDLEGDKCIITHWMPLPSPPKEGEEKEWLDFNQHRYSAGKSDYPYDKLEVKFKSGEICMWLDIWPNETVTHFRLKNLNL